MNIFIDANILLFFYQFTSDELEELQKLIVLLNKKKARLFVPDQVASEVRRNRAPQIAKALGRIREQKLNLELPHICKAYPEYQEMRKLLGEAEKIQTNLLNKLTEDAKKFGLKADAVVSNLLSLGERIVCDAALVQRARDRADVGNPPGKEGSLGDAVNWEALLQGAPTGEDLYVITDDKDFASPLDPDRLSDVLQSEWKREKKSKVHLYKRLAQFFKDKYPDIKLAPELEMNLLIEELAKSESFAQTHNLIGRLSSMKEFTPKQAKALVSAAAGNGQIYMILTDSDVAEFYQALLKQHADAADPQSLEFVKQFLEPKQHTESGGVNLF